MSAARKLVPLDGRSVTEQERARIRERVDQLTIREGGCLPELDDDNPDRPTRCMVDSGKLVREMRRKKR